MSENTGRADGAPWRNFYGRRHGKALRAGQKRLLDETLPRLSVPGAYWEENPERHPTDLTALFPDAREIWLEIGFGAGEHLMAQAEANPDVGLIGCEPFMNGVAMLLSHMQGRGIGNLRIHAGDARELFDVLAPGAVARLFLLYPDPWPKARHHKRRFVSPENLDQIARVLRPGGAFHVATDIDDYVRHTQEHLAERSDFDPSGVGLRTPWPDWRRTRYEAKAVREGRQPSYLTFHRR